MELNLKNPIIAALDVDSLDECLRLADQLNGLVGAIKLGPRLLMRYGGVLVQKISQFTPVFVDNKYLDIPSTMEAAVRATFESGATLATVHAWAGPEALTRLAKLEMELNQTRPFKILAVTVLTSFSQDTLPEVLRGTPIQSQVLDLAKTVVHSGLSGLVCSPKEVGDVRSLAPNAFLVTPGVRLPGGDLGDQKRVETPRSAISKGASAIVMGRPLLSAKNISEEVEKVLKDIQF